MKRIIFSVIVTLFIVLLFALFLERDTYCAGTRIDAIEDARVKTSEQGESPKYTEHELNILARVVYAEAGSDWITDEHQRAVASVVINRKNDHRFPNTIEDVVYQKGQYACVYNGMIKRSPNQRAYDNAKYVLDNGITIPCNVVWQSQFKQGRGVYKYIQSHYFCY